MHWLIHMRTDEGRPTADNRVRRALKLATNHQALIDGVRPRLASVGNGFTPVGPGLRPLPPREAALPGPEESEGAARRSRVSPTVCRLDLIVPQQDEAVRIAALWKKQVARIGVDVETEVVPPEVYYGNGPRSWLAVDLGVTDWGAGRRPSPTSSWPTPPTPPGAKRAGRTPSSTRSCVESTGSSTRQPPRGSTTGRRRS